MKNAPYMCRYVAQQIGAISPDDIAESHTKRYPTALVIGPMHFVKAVHSHLQENGFPQAVLRSSAKTEVDILDGYARIAKNEHSRLGWRVIAFCDHPDDYEAIISLALNEDRALGDLLPVEFRTRHLNIASILRRMLANELVSTDDLLLLEDATGLKVEEIRASLGEEAKDDAEPPEAKTKDPTAPSIICTSLVGAKGLSAGYVFVVGFNNQDFPRDPAAITDQEICCFIVALSRGRKECHLVSCTRYAGQFRGTSKLASWLGGLTDRRTINKSYW
jgi:superfamily I DNA/RNA helicase